MADTNRMRPLNYPPMRVEVSVSPEQLGRLFARVEAAFSDVQYESPFRDQDSEEFFRVGKEQVDLLTGAAARCGVSLDGLNTCLELGCGYGRATVVLAETFPKVIAVDISAPHIKAAKANAARRQRDNITFIHANTADSLTNLPTVDVFFSRFALQHSPPPIMKHVLDLVLSKLNPGGLAYFQISTYQLGYSFDCEKYLATEPDHRIAEMHMLPQPDLFRLLEEHGCRLCEVREDSSGGEQTISFHLLAQKRKARTTWRWRQLVRRSGEIGAMRQASSDSIAGRSDSLITSEIGPG
jgi:SAM-dependent methyltransferase